MRVAVLLSGCGVYDGSEIYETTLTLLALDRLGVSYQCMAPNVEQAHVINHITGEPMTSERRNVLVEAARLARGDIIDLHVANASDYEALIIPGGFGAAKNLCDFAFKGTEMTVHEEVRDFARAMHQAGKPVGLICIAPVMTGALFGEVRCTIGNDADTAAAVNALGAQHVDCAVDDVVVDAARKVVSTPAYMLAGRISEAAAGIDRLVQEVVALAR